MQDRVQRQVDQLLQTPPPDAVQCFFKKVTESSPGLEVRLDAGEGKGKGVFATKDFDAGSVLISEPPLVGMQHTANRPGALVCSHCFQYIGSVETQLGVRLASQHRAAQLEEGSEGASTNDGSDGDGSQQGSAQPDTEELIYALLSGDLQLPLTDQVPLPDMVLCPGGCSDDKYCSERCAQAAWRQYHSLLCLGDACREQGASPKGKGKAQAQAQVQEGSREEEARRQRARALQEFNDHADETNDVFLLAAKVVATVLLAAQQQLEAGDVAATGAAGSSQAALGSGGGGGSGSADAEAEPCWAALQAAWEPFAVGHKAVWWEALALPEDVTDEADFRQGVQQLAADSLELLREALFDPRFPALFDLRVWGSVVGLFELNNLDLFVPSPVQRWQGLIEELPEAEREEVEEEVGGLLEALSQLDEDGCEGNAFYTLQSCVNHSCVPNAHAFKRDEDTDGSAVILALRGIQAGEEITISYVDEDASLEERAADLADYGFTCSCDKCCAERLAGELLLG